MRLGRKQLALDGSPVLDHVSKCLQVMQKPLSLLLPACTAHPMAYLPLPFLSFSQQGQIEVTRLRTADSEPNPRSICVLLAAPHVITHPPVPSHSPTPDSHSLLSPALPHPYG